MSFSLNSLFRQLQSGVYSNLRPLQYCIQAKNSLGNPLQRSQSCVSSIIFFISFRRCLTETSRPYSVSQGRYPFMKQISMSPRDYKSSLRECLFPFITWRLENLRVPTKLSVVFTVLLRGRLRVVSRYGVAKAQSIVYICCSFLPKPTKKLLGWMSRCTKFLQWMNSKLERILSAIMRTVFNEKWPPHSQRQSQRELPRSQVMRKLKSPFSPVHSKLGMPIPPCISSRTLPQLATRLGLMVFDSHLIEQSVSDCTLRPEQMVEYLPSQSLSQRRYRPHTLIQRELIFKYKFNYNKQIIMLDALRRPLKLCSLSQANEILPRNNLRRSQLRVGSMMAAILNQFKFTFRIWEWCMIYILSRP